MAGLKHSEWLNGDIQTLGVKTLKTLGKTPLWGAMFEWLAEDIVNG